MSSRVFIALLLFLATGVAPAAENLIRNGDFEQGTAGWGRIWSRAASAQATLDPQVKHGGRQALRVEHAGAKDFSMARADWLNVQPGQIYEFSGWVRAEGQGKVSLGIAARDADGQVTHWFFAGRTAKSNGTWQELRCRFVIPPKTAAIYPRLTGDGPSTAWLDDVVLRLCGTLDGLRTAPIPRQLTCSNDKLEVTLDTAGACLTVRDRRGNRTWKQRNVSHPLVVSAAAAGQGLRATLLDAAEARKFELEIDLAKDAAEVRLRLSSSGEMSGPLHYPPPMLPQKGSLLILPVNEGISYPANDATLPAMHYHLYGGHGLCMPWWGMVEGQAGMMAIVETPNDAAVQVPRLDGLLCLAPEWMPEKQYFGGTRCMRYVFFDDGGYVAMAKRYRQYAHNTGLLKTFVQKRADNPNVDLLIGAVNVWCWDRDPVGMCRELHSAGIRRILWSAAAKPDQIRQMNEMGVLTSRYDIYQDCMNPANFPKLRGLHGDWTTEAWPKDIILRADGGWQPGWEVRGKDGVSYPCGVLCDRRAVDYARKRIPAELKTHPYRCRFIDTTTASPWNECYSPEHPMTRSESRQFKMDLLQYISKDCGLITGSETGHDAAVPVVHYFEGMLSLGPYRVPDAGRDMQRVVEDVPERVAKFQTGHVYRLPLWELVYHDCVVAQWYWGDYNNKLPKLWDRRDLFNALYGTPPMLMFNASQWRAQRARFVQSYRTATAVARATGYAEMLWHRWLTPDHAVQQTRFANGVTVTVNFGDAPYATPDGSRIGPSEHRVEGIAGPE